MEVFLLKNVADYLSKKGLEVILKTENFAHTSTKIEVENKINIKIYKDINEISAGIKILNIPEDIACMIIFSIARDVEKYSLINIRTIKKDETIISANHNITSDNFADVILSFFSHYKKTISNVEVKKAIKAIDKSYRRIVTEQNRISSLLPTIG